MKRRIILLFAAATAVMYVSANPTITGVTAKQWFPWNGKVAIIYIYPDGQRDVEDVGMEQTIPLGSVTRRVAGSSYTTQFVK